jgi:hypothetical protein
MTPDATPGDLPPAERAAFERATRWASIRERQASHDRAVVVEAYFGGYFVGMRDDLAGVAVPAHDASNGTAADDSEEAAVPTHAAPSVSDVVVRARVEGYADGRHWREPAKLGGIVRLAAYHSGKSVRRFAAEDLMRTPRRVRRILNYQEDVEESVSTELLRRLHLIRGT